MANNVISMKRGRGRPKKDPFDSVPTDFKDAVAQSTPEEINLRIAEKAKLMAEIATTMKSDLDLTEARTAVKDLSEPYTEDIKACKQSIAFCMQVLKDKGST